MSTTTTNYNLIKPELTDTPDITALNQNWTTIDSKLKEQHDSMVSLQAAVGSPLVASTVAGMTNHDKIYVYTPGFNHEKQIVADGVLAFCGTINFDFRSLTHHFECGVTMYNVPCIKEMVADFEEMEKASLRVEEGKKLNFLQSAIVAVIKVFRTLL